MSRVKICGLSRIEDVEAVNCALPDYVGFVFAPSRRRIDVRTAAGLREKLDSRIKAVGVFVNEDISVITEIVNNGIVDLIQLHGDEDEAYVQRIKEWLERQSEGQTRGQSEEQIEGILKAPHPGESERQLRRDSRENTGEQSKGKIKEHSVCPVIKAVGIGSTSFVAPSSTPLVTQQHIMPQPVAHPQMLQNDVPHNERLSKPPTMNLTAAQFASAQPASSQTQHVASLTAALSSPLPSFSQLPQLPTNPDYLLFDTLSTQRGGGGIAFDWKLLKEYHGTPYFLAGGLTIENVADVIQLLAPFCVDVSSGVETDGYKDPVKINEFVKAVRSVC